MVESSKYVGDWRADVLLKAQSVWENRPPLGGPVALDLLFVFSRPKSHHQASKRDRPVKHNAPRFHVSRPDLDKLIRAINDALTGVIYRDDSQVARIQSEKIHSTNQCGVEITISELPRTQTEVLDL